MVAVNYITEKTELGDYSLWKRSGQLGKTTTLEQMYAEGWKIKEVVRTDNLKKIPEILLFMERETPLLK